MAGETHSPCGLHIIPLRERSCVHCLLAAADTSERIADILRKREQRGGKRETHRGAPPPSPRANPTRRREDAPRWPAVQLARAAERDRKRGAP